VLEKRKGFHAYSGTNGSLFRLWLRPLHVMLVVVLIVCLGHEQWGQWYATAPREHEPKK
jgi:hypothetical protein